MFHQKLSIRGWLICSLLFVIAIGLWQLIPNPSSPGASGLQKSVAKVVPIKKASAPTKIALAQTTVEKIDLQDKVVSTIPSHELNSSTAIVDPFAKAEVILSRALPFIYLCEFNNLHGFFYIVNT